MANVVTALQAKFEARVDEIVRLTAHSFKGYGPEAKQEAIQNTLGLCWKYLLRLNEQGKADDENCFKQMIGFAIKHTKLGRMPQGREARKPKCVLDYGKRRHGGVRIDDGVNLTDHVGQQSAVPDIAAFRIDTPAFLATLTERNRGIAIDLANGHGTTEVAKEWGVSPGAISQFRERFRRWYAEYHGEA